MMVIVRIAVLVVAAVLGLLLLLNWETLSERARGNEAPGAPQMTRGHFIDSTEYLH